MQDRASGPRPVAVRGSAQDRLQSWKEIAAYLGRDVRSVYRWEKTAGLPVYRLQHEKHSTVYAFKSELDAWVAGRSIGPRPKGRGGRVVLVAALAGVIALVLTAWLAIGWPARPSAEPPVALPFTSSPGVELQPALSPDGRKVAFAWNGDHRGNFDIFVKLAGGGPPLQLTGDPAHEYSPAWSPDGDSIAFLRQKDAERVTILIAPALGGAARTLGVFASSARLDWSRPGPFLAWSHDGRWLVMAARQEANSPDCLLRISVETGETLPITAPPHGIPGDAAPAVSPDGATLAFIRRLSWGASELCLLPVARDLAPAGEVRRLETGSAWNASPAWSPDGETLLFSTGSMEAPHLAGIAASGRGGATRLAGFGSHGWQPSLARTREGAVRLVYVHHYESVNLWSRPLHRDGPGSQLIASAHRSYEPDYSPDGSRIAFLSDRSGYVEVWVARSDGSDPRQWTSLKQRSLGAPRWSPDSLRIAFTAPGPDGSSIYWIDEPGATPKLAPDSSSAGYLAWAPDGQSIYFSSNRGGATNVWRVDLEPGAAVQVTTQDSCRVPAVSPDGRFLFFLRLAGPDGANHLFRVPLTGGDAKRVLSFVDAYSVCRAGIAYRYYRPGPKREGPHMEFHRFETGETVRLAATPKPLRYGIATSPDCRDLLSAQADYDVSDLMMVDPFH